MTVYLSVLMPLPVDKPFTYQSDADMMPGQIVTVPFGKRKLPGVVMDVDRKAPEGLKEIKPVLTVEPAPPVNLKFIDFLERAAKYNIEPVGKILHLALNTKIIDKAPVPKPEAEPEKIKLSGDQQAAADHLKKKIGKKYSTTLLQGVTGSGKTEVYFEAVKETLKQGKQVLILVPEIALTKQLERRIENRLKMKPTVWHSSETPKKKKQAFKEMLEGTGKIIIGARSALFLPIKDLGLIIIDEEHEGAYKQEDTFVYQARDMAVLRAFAEDLPIILATATPSLETIVNVKDGKYDAVYLTERHEEAALTNIDLIDLRAYPPEKNKSLSPALTEKIKAVLEKKEQVLLFLNRKGYAPLLLCRACGYKFVCPDCTSFQVVHKKRGRLICHYCGKSSPMPKTCPACKEEDCFLEIGPGIERLFEETKALFPEAKIETLTGDDAHAEEILDRMEKGDIDILIGTQILAKGHHFPKLTLVGVIDADDGLRGTDLRASERTFQLLSQIAGRSGREKDRPGEAYLQTAVPDHPVLLSIKAQDMEEFVALEIEERKALYFPPFGKLAAVVLSGKDQEILYKTAKELEKAASLFSGLQILGPAPAPIFLLRQKYRFRFLIKAKKDVNLQGLLQSWLSCVKLPKAVHLKVDIDPYHFL